jgi:two-component system, chemotaxis family, response regulator Rcp1
MTVPETMPSTPRSDPVRILLAEDNAGDVRLIREVLRESRIDNELDVTRDGVETMEYLRRKPPTARPAHPGLILLDLNMPRKDGREVLSEIKSDPDLRRIPVVILTSSPGDDEVMRAYDSHANCFVRKPSDFDQFDSVLRKIEDFWFSVATLPPH